MNYKKKLLISLLLVLITLTVLFAEEHKQHCGKHFPISEEATSSESICGTIQIAENQLQLVEDSTQVVFNLIIPENLEIDLEKIEIGKKYIFSGKSSKSGFVVEKFTIYETKQAGGNHFVDANKCIACRLCVNQCPEGAISMVNGKAVIDQEKCIDCGICVNGNGRFKGCPVKAIQQK